MGDKGREDERLAEDEKFETLDERVIIQLQLSEYHHIQSMSRGFLAVTLAILAIGTTGFSALYYPVPTIPSTPSEYQPALENFTMEIPFSVASFTTSAGAMQSLVFIMFTMISLLIGVNLVLDLLIPRNPLITSLYKENNDKRLSDIVSSNRDALQSAQEQYISAGLRLILSILFAINAFILWNFAASLKIWSLFWIQIWVLTPGALLSKGFRSLMTREETDSSNDRPLMVEALFDEGERIQHFTFRSYEKWLWAVDIVISVLIVLMWVLLVFLPRMEPLF
jgi:hypothetical protein